MGRQHRGLDTGADAALRVGRARAALLEGTAPCLVHEVCALASPCIEVPSYEDVARYLRICIVT